MQSPEESVETASIFETDAPRPFTSAENNLTPRGTDVFWLSMKNNYHASLASFSVGKVSLTVFVTYVVPVLLAGATYCIPLEPAFEGRDANPTFLWVVSPMQQVLRFAGVWRRRCSLARGFAGRGLAALRR